MAVIAKPAEEKSDPIIQEMMEAGLHFGHRTSKTHPKMKPYINAVRNTVHIIDLAQTKTKLDEAMELLRQMVAEGNIILFIGTKKQSQIIIEEEAIKSVRQPVSQKR